MMRTTVQEVPYNPQGVGVEFKGEKIECLAGQMTLRGEEYEVAAASLKPKTHKTKLAQTEVWLVFDGTKIVYHAVHSLPGSPAKSFEGSSFEPLARLTLLAIPAGKGLSDAGGQLVTIEPMVQKQGVPRCDAEGRRLFDLWQRVKTNMTLSEAQDQGYVGIGKAPPKKKGTYNLKPLSDVQDVAVTI